jgi:hypothetical protein
VTISPSRPALVAGPGALAAVLLLSVTGLAAGCSEGFDPYNRLVTPRVLAIRSEPVAPAPGESTVLDALFYLPPGDSVASVSWSWCPFAGSSVDGYPCLITEEDLAALNGGSSPVPSYDLGQGETATFEHSLDPDLLATVCENGAEQAVELLDCEGGFPVQIKLSLVTEQGHQIDSVRTLRLRFDESHDPNQNPRVEGLSAVLGDVDEEIGDEPSVTVPRKEETIVRAQIPAEVIETYTGLDDDGQPEERSEDLILTWFVESGDTKSQRTVFIEDVESLEDASENEWEPDGPDDYPRDTSEVVVVVRDDRDGVAWQRGVVTLGDLP